VERFQMREELLGSHGSLRDDRVIPENTGC
jgi:hypothetical protein